jgi:hypothetical protein
MLDQLGLEEFKPNPDRTKFFPLEKLCVAIGRKVRGRPYIRFGAI